MATPRSFYSELAAWFADQGYSVLTFDYRGTGDSCPEELNYDRITMEDWARRDLPGALKYAQEEFPDGPRYVLAHSLSGQVIGLNGDELELDALATFSSQTCYWRRQHPNQRYRMLFSSYVLFPLLNRIFGYLPWSRLFGGEDVPPEVARTWYRWCRDP
jgi:predicted alpha/beta hydrolase